MFLFVVFCVCEYLVSSSKGGPSQPEAEIASIMPPPPLPLVAASSCFAEVRGLRAEGGDRTIQNGPGIKVVVKIGSESGMFLKFGVLDA